MPQNQTGPNGTEEVFLYDVVRLEFPVFNLLFLFLYITLLLIQFLCMLKHRFEFVIQSRWFLIGSDFRHFFTLSLSQTLMGK